MHTLAVVAAFFRTVEPNPLAQGVKQRRARVELEAVQ
jgi:hypothetical protein